MLLYYHDLSFTSLYIIREALQLETSIQREEGSGWGTHVYLWRIHFDIWQN